MIGPTRFVVASANPDKAAEIFEILQRFAPGSFELLPRPADVPDVEETGTTFEANARLKAEALRSATGVGAIADDSGLVVDALDGAPGVYSARYAGPLASYRDNVTKLLEELASSENRAAHFETVAIAALADGREILCRGEVHGRIAASPSGDGGFGYDPIFVPDEGDGRTFGEFTGEEKHAISARGRAFRALAERLISLHEADR